MKYFVFNLKSKKNALVNQSLNEEGINELKHLRSSINLNLKRGDKILLLEERLYQGFENVFTFTGEVTNISKPNRVSLDSGNSSDGLRYFRGLPEDLDKLLRRGQFIFSIEFKLDKKLSKMLSLKDFSYSLLVIKNFKKPYSHFSNPIRSISKEDYETISNELRACWDFSESPKNLDKIGYRCILV